MEYDENGNPVPIGATDFRRSLGYCELYDNMAPYAAMDFDTVRIKFRYDNLDWMVQMWKGSMALPSAAKLAFTISQPRVWLSFMIAPRMKIHW